MSRLSFIVSELTTNGELFSSGKMEIQVTLKLLIITKKYYEKITKHTSW